ncbi:hypothetical protein D3C76_1676690 [compost metagenome]
MDQACIANHAAAQVISLKPLAGAFEQARAKDRLDFMQRLGRTRLRQRHGIGGLAHRAVFIQGNQQAQLLEAQARNDGGEGWQHGYT